jgi:hypothetical protein
MSKASRNKRVVLVVTPSAHDKDLEKIRQIEFQQAWLEARERDPSLPEAPPEGIPEEAKRVITHLVRRVLQLELEWS